MRTSRRDLPLVLLVVALLGLASVLVTAAGPAVFGPPRIAAIGGGRQADGEESLRSVTATDRTLPAPDGGIPGWLLVVVWTVGLLGVAWLVLRSLRRADPTPDLAEPAPETGDAAGSRLAVLGDLRSAARAVADDLRDVDPERVADVVVLAWERLETAAERAGTARAPAATATEFTTHLLTRHGADDAATTVLLRLYHRARFSSASLPAGAADEAVAAYEDVAASLGSVARPTHGVRSGG